MTELSKAKKLLLENSHTCVIIKGGSIYTSDFRGVRPLVKWYREGLDVKGASCADKVIGRATAFLYLLLGVREVYAGVISTPALDVLRAHGVECEYGELVPNIINRSGNGICPFEDAVMSADTPDCAYTLILDKMKEMNIQV